MLFGQEVGTGDPLMQLGIELGQARYGPLSDRNRLNELLHGEGDITDTDTINDKHFNVGDTALKLRHRRKTKLDSNFKPEKFKVVAAYRNNTYKLCDMSGRLLKQNINHSILQRIPVDSHIGGG